MNIYLAHTSENFQVITMFSQFSYHTMRRRRQRRVYMKKELQRALDFAHVEKMLLLAFRMAFKWLIAK